MTRIFITGFREGLRRNAALELLGQGHQIIVHERTAARAAGMDELTAAGAQIVVGDLASAGQTVDLARQVNAIGAMDAVIHNAGVFGQADRGTTSERRSTTLAVNTLAPYLLSAHLHRSKRLVFLSSGMYTGGTGSLAHWPTSTGPHGLGAPQQPTQAVNSTS